MPRVLGIGLGVLGGWAIPMGVLGGWAFSYGPGIPVLSVPLPRPTSDEEKDCLACIWGRCIVVCFGGTCQCTSSGFSAHGSQLYCAQIILNLQLRETRNHQNARTRMRIPTPRTPAA
jgi:hypothetical protein